MIPRALFALAAVALACGPSAAPVRVEPPPERRAEPTSPPAVADGTQPRAVVVVVIDQLASHALEKYLPFLSEDGALRRGIARGAFHRSVVYSYAGTYTAPGHAAIHTGAPPAFSGVVANQVWDYARADSVASVDDGESAVLGVEGSFASPRVLRADTVADVLSEATDGRAMIASVSFKDRGAVLGGGRRPDLVLWYEKSIPGFTTSAYYGDSVPGWLDRWHAEHPIDGILGVWEADDAELYARELGPDRVTGEGDFHGLGVTFPHDVRASSSPYSALRATPASSVYLMALAAEVADRMDIGADAVVDLFAISISSVDYAGHVFGPQSWEYADNLIKVDRALGELLDGLERDHGPLAVLITSDHGVAFLPERARAQSGRGGRLLGPRAFASLETTLDRQLGRADYLAAFIQPFVYLTPHAKEPERRARVVEVAARWLSAQPEIEAAFDTHEAAGWREADDALRRSVGLSVPDDPSGDIFVVPAYGYVIDEGTRVGYGTSHGTPWDYDQTVPVIFWGPGVDHLETSEPLPQDRVATTIAALLGIDPPERAGDEPLPGAPQPHE